MNHFLRRYTSPFGRIYFEKDGSGGGGATTVQMDWPEDVLKAFKNLVSREGGEKDAAMTLFNENYELRKEVRELKDKKTLSDEEFADFEKFKALGKPDDVKKKLEEGEEATEKVGQFERESSRSEVADIYKWNAKVLNRLAGDETKIETRTRKKDDGTLEAFAVVKTDDGEKALDEYAKENWGEFMTALEASESNASSANGRQHQEGRSYPSQNSTKSRSDSDDDDPVSSIIDRNKKQSQAANPLRSKRSTEQGE